MPDTVIAIDIGGTKIAGGLLVDGERLEYRTQVPTEAGRGREAVIASAIALAQSLKDRMPSAAAIGVGTIGQVNYAAGSVEYANENLPGWTGMPIRLRLHDALGLPVFVGNDVHLHALAEAHLGAARGRQTVIMTAVGTGIGGAVIVNGRLWRGASGLAGEIGHIQIRRNGPLCGCGRRGCVEALASGPRIAAAYVRAEGSTQPVTTSEVAARAVNGDLSALRVFRAAGQALAQALSGLVNVLNPDCVVVGGGVAEVGELLMGPLRSYLFKQSLEPNVRNLHLTLAELGGNAALYGAGLLPGLAREDPGFGSQP